MVGTETPTWTLVGYRAESRGYYGRSNGRDPIESGFVHEQALPREKLVKRIAELKLEEYEEILYFPDVYEEVEGSDPVFVERIDYALEQEAAALVAGLSAAAVEKQRLAVEAERARAEKAREQYERNELAKLKAKYEV